MYLIIHDIVGKCVTSIQFVAGDTLHHLLVDLSQLLLIEMVFFCSVFIVCAAQIVCHMFYFILFNFNLLMLWQ